MQRTTKLRAGLTVTAVALLTAGLMQGAATAGGTDDPRNDKPVRDATVSSSAPTSARLGAHASAADVIEYWTPKRMRNAIPMKAPVPSKAEIKDLTVAPNGDSGQVRPAEATATDRLQRKAFTGNGVQVSATPTVGHVYFHNPVNGNNYRCSGSALNSASKRLVLTAAHCVHGGPSGRWMQNWVFVPYYNYGNRPYGTFPARTLRTFNAWINDRSYDHDAAMVTTWNNEDGDRLVNTVGGNGMRWNYPREFDATIIGYPGNRAGGEWQWACWGKTDDPWWTGRPRLHCGFGGGSSGSPWFNGYNNSSRLGYSNGVMSTLDSNGWNYSPYFDNKMKSMYDDTAGD